MRRSWNFNRVTALLLAATAAALLAAVPYQVAKPLRLFGRSLTGLDPALFPRLVLGAMLLVALRYFAISPRLDERSLFQGVDRAAYFRVAVTVACLAGYALALPAIGYVASGIVLMLVLTVFYGNRDHRLTVAVSVLVPFAIYLGTTRLLQVSLPEFPFF